MKKQKITVKMMLEWQKETKVQYAAQYDTGKSKSLSLDLMGNWIVMYNKEIVYTGNASEAVEKYNSYNF